MSPRSRSCSRRPATRANSRGSSSCCGRWASRKSCVRARWRSRAGPRRARGRPRRRGARACPRTRAWWASRTNPRRRKGTRMPAKIYYDQDADLSLLKGKKIAIIGYGSQGHAHALNLKDSGQDVVVGLYKGSRSWAKAEKEGLRVVTVAEAAQMSDVVMILLPDQAHRATFEESIRGSLAKGKTVMVAHGFSVHFNQVVAPADVDVSMIAPKAPG